MRKDETPIPGLIAFWSNDRFPYVLSGPTISMTTEGLVRLGGGWGGQMLARPIKMLPLAEGKALEKKLNALESARNDALRAVEQEFDSKLCELTAEFLPSRGPRER